MFDISQILKKTNYRIHIEISSEVSSEDGKHHGEEYKWINQGRMINVVNRMKNNYGIGFDRMVFDYKKDIKYGVEKRYVKITLEK